MHLFVVLYEEPFLRYTFGDDDAQDTARVRRWLSHRPIARPPWGTA
jgi:hypothetical protein